MLLLGDGALDSGDETPDGYEIDVDGDGSYAFMNGYARTYACICFIDTHMDDRDVNREEKEEDAVEVNYVGGDGGL